MRVSLQRRYLNAPALQTYQIQRTHQNAIIINIALYIEIEKREEHKRRARVSLSYFLLSPRPFLVAHPNLHVTLSEHPQYIINDMTTGPVLQLMEARPCRG